MSRIIWLRIGIAVASLLGFAILILMAGSGGGPQSDSRVIWAARALLFPIAVIAVAIVGRQYWARWLGLGAGVGVLPWAAVLSWSAPNDWRPRMALGLSTILILSLLGRAMFEVFEGRARRLSWQDPALALVRWAIIFNLASVVSLYMFAVAYRPLVNWHVAIPATFLAVLVSGTWLLGMQKTAGLLLVGLGCVGLVPAGTYFVLSELGRDPRALLWVVLLGPGIVLGCALLVAYGRPVLRQLFSR